MTICLCFQNTIRIMASRVPLVLEADLVHDLIEYKGHKDKGVVMAARALLEVYRVLGRFAMEEC